ncbi:MULTISPECIES: ribonuclease J [Filomicrobium]|uniref:Ribonuclease J n=1 Tax=Filomicrobium insigne TaxID=418854 RepID=A0A1H0R3N4_9HYPH|nr:MULTISPECIES: ribonuclease J [Filomicrobium]MCV0369409.1 ribonuclease J [Filomicrobium sp.]SDP24030.1 ribonuclease J [Filomicrobium insigne]
MARKPANGEDELVFLALGGLGEIGMNAYLYGVGAKKSRKWLMVDLGITFPGEGEPGVDVVLPDLRFIEAQRDALAGIVITHAHEDHIGAVIELWPSLQVPIYATPFTVGMLRAKLAQFGGQMAIEINEIPVGGRFQAGPFDVELVSMAHSIPETSGLILRTSVGTALHTSDWKIDPEPMTGEPTDAAKLQALGAEGVHAMICDSTNALREGISPSESKVARSLTEIIKKATHRVAVTTFASNVGRVKAVAEAATASGRQLVVAGRALHRVIEVAKETGYLPEKLQYLDQQEFKYIDRSDVVLLLTGSQGESRAAMARVADNEHPDIQLSKGDLVIFSSRNIPGNEKAVGRIQNKLAQIGCDVLTDNEALVHVTGHPRRDELKQLYSWIKPEVAVPMHGEARHLREHARLATNAGVPQVVSPLNGDIVRLAPQPAEILENVPTSRLYRDGRLIIPAEEGPVRERRKLSVVGIVVVSIALSRRGIMIGEADLAMDGIPFVTEDGDAMEDVALDAVDATMASIPVARRKDHEMVRDAVRRAVRSSIYEEWGKKPIVKVLLHVIDQQSAPRSK